MKPFKILLALLLFVSACFFSTESKAQAGFVNFSLSKTSTTAGVDTITGTITYPGSIAFGAIATMTPASGTSGKLVLFGSHIGNTYTRLDSTTVSLLGAAGAGAGVTDYPFNHFTNSKFDKPDFMLYKFVWYQTLGSVTAAKGRAMVRTGGN